MIDYAFWQRRAFKELRKRRAPNDIVHHVTYASDWFPVAAAFAPAPLVIGPVGGAMHPEARRWFRCHLTWSERLKEAMRAQVTGLGRRILRQLAARRGAVVIANNEDTASFFGIEDPALLEPNVVAAPTEPAAGGGGGGGKTLAYVGRITGWKGIRLAIAALQALPDFTLEVAGEGSALRSSQRLALRLGVADRVVFLGQQSRAEVAQLMARSSGLLQLSIHDGSPFSTGEAIASGLPVIALNSGGASLMVKRTSCGAVVELGPDLVARVAAAAVALAPPPGLNPATFSQDRLAPIMTSWYDMATSDD